MTQANRETLRMGAMFARARSMYPSQVLRILALLAGWAAVWGVVELLVFNFSSRPGGPIWLVLHLSYFWWTSYWEAAILESALAAIDRRPPAWRSRLTDHAFVIRYTAVKLLLLPLTLAGLALLLIPGLYLMARWGMAFFFLIDTGCGARTALRRSGEATRGRRGRFMGVSLVLILFNLLGAALLGIGLLFTVPMTALSAAYVFRTVTTCASADSIWRPRKDLNLQHPA